MSTVLVCPNCGDVDASLTKSLEHMSANADTEPLRVTAATIVANYNDPTGFNRAYWRRRLLELVLLGLQSESHGQNLPGGRA